MKTAKPVILSFLLIFALGNVLINVKGNDDIPITPNDEFFFIAIDFFEIDPDNYRLVVMGEVANPLNLSLEEIKAMPVTSEIVRLSCVAYRSGATSLTGVANWTGVRLSHILSLAKIDYFRVKDISFHTPNLSPEGYSTSLSLEESFWGDVILAYEMNGEPLPKEHGFPLRLVCPRFYGYKWIKWVAYINVTTIDYKGYWERVGYNDTPYVDIDLPIYYSPVGSDIPIHELTRGSESSESKSTPWPVIELILPLVATIVVTRFYINQRKRGQAKLRSPV
ncbi:MAG: molybdopterin-dependent oxidoreductase [Candidatus Heimdallarchaeota archaeon]|nr:MAG: molybdopterin-dependent oxidoreductase [Candidatus Heimdallarchaeota archaeon]